MAEDKAAAVGQWGAADVSWEGKAGDQSCTYRFNNTEVQILQSAGLESKQTDQEQANPSGSVISNIGATGLVVWYSAQLLCRYIVRRHEAGTLCMQGCSVLDIGAGTGVLGLCCAAYGANAVLSDYSVQVLQLLQANVAANKAVAGSARVVQFDWRGTFPLGAEEVAVLSDRQRDAPGTFDFIVATDILFSPDLVPSLVASLDSLCSCETECLLANEDLWSCECCSLLP